MTIYVNFDIETTGTVPGLHSMISFGAVAHRDTDFATLDEVQVNFLEAEDAGWDPGTREWWAQEEQAEAWAVTIGGYRWKPVNGVQTICAWLRDLLAAHKGPIVFVAYPASFDMSFLNYYMQRYCPEEWRELTFNKDVGWGCMDILTLAAVVLDKPYLEATKSAWPEMWQAGNPLPHTALNDARAQAFSFIRMMKTAKRLVSAAIKG